MIKITKAELGQAYLCQKILQLLPEWFGIEAAVTHYIHEIGMKADALNWMKLLLTSESTYRHRRSQI
ncbi:hypothetical protein NIES3974_32620 [Calothrix sp. NIES-3974]|nr:hypothetical protein NIES3974_32620 [Calothrix sp. NIES-3974]